MFLSEYQESGLGRVWVPDTFYDYEIGQLPGFVCERSGRELVLDTLDGWVHIYEEFEPTDPNLGIGFLKKAWKSVRRSVKKVFRKVRSIPKRVFKEIKRSASKINLARKKLTKSVLKNKYTRQLVRVAGAAFAPFTGGLSLAAAEASARYGKARYVQGLSRSSAFKRGAVGGAIGLVGGKAISAGYSAIKAGGAKALNPFASKAITPPGLPTGASTAVHAATGGGVVPSVGSGGLWGTIGKGALKVGTKLAPTVASQVLQMKMAKAAGAGMQEVEYDPYAWGDPNIEQYADYGSYADPNAMENFYGGGGSTVVPDGLYDEETEAIDTEFMTPENWQKFGPLAILAVASVASVVIMRRGKRGKK